MNSYSFISEIENLGIDFFCGVPDSLLKEFCLILESNSLINNVITANEGSVLGAYSMANKNMESWFVYVGVPAKKFKKRASGLLELVKIMDEKWM
jgi:acetyltransferase-like isoleucine patch superfamily enzyme